MNLKKSGVWLTAAALFLSLGIAAGSAKAAESETINQGVSIGGVDVSGMTEEEATKAVEESLGNGTGGTYTVNIGDETVTATSEDFGMAWNNREVVHEAMQVGKSGNLIKRYKDNKDLEQEPKDFAVDYAPQETYVEAFVNEMAAAYNREAVEGDISMANGYPEVTGGESGIAVNVEASVEAVMAGIESGSTTLDLVAEVTKPEVTAEDLEQVTDVLGQATTYYTGSAGRIANVERGAALLNGHLIQPGESFSVTQAVVPFTEENGYYLAPSYESGQVVESYGGGICQVSTTLYNAVIRAELQVDERHNHTMEVSYVEPSMDAAIAEGLMDFVFTNDTDAPIYIYGAAYQGTITFIIYGHETRDSGRSISFRSETISQTDPNDNIQLIGVSTQNIGYLSQTQTAHQGLEAQLWKDITYADGTTESVQVNSSSYIASPAIYEVGINSSNAAAVAAIQTAIANNDLNGVYSVINGDYGDTQSTESETESQTTESQSTEAQTTEAPTEPVTQAPETEAPTTQAPETQAPETQAPETEASTQAPETQAASETQAPDYDDNVPNPDTGVEVIG